MNEQHFDMVAGESRTLTMTARDDGQAPVDLTGSAVTWSMAIGDEGLTVTKPGGLVEPQDGVFSVSIDPADTAGRCGLFQYQALADAGGVLTVIASGTVRVRKSIVEVA